jgi:ATP-dependent RNA helicase DDX56/DBP9
MLALNYLIQYGFKDGKILVFVSQAKLAYSLLMMLNDLLVDNVVVLNDCYPLLSRSDIIEKFNSGEIKVLITNQDPEFMKTNFKRIKTSRNKIEEMEMVSSIEKFNISRGIDFNLVAAVINFDLPPTSDEYIHRIGRTARSNQIGIAISFLNKKEKISDIWQEICENQKKKDVEIVEYPIEKDGLENFRYRVVSCYSGISGKLKQLQTNLVNNEIKNAIRIKNKWDSKKLMNHDYSKIQQGVSLAEYLSPQNQKQSFIPFLF